MDVGGRLFKEQRYMMAFYRYQHACKAISEGSGWRGKDAGKAEELKGACHLNMAACYLKLGDHRGAIAACSMVLEGQRENVKALFRRATAYHSLGEHMSAIKDLTRAVELSPDNVEA